MGIGALVSAAVSVFHNHTPFPMVTIMASCVFISISILLFGKGKIMNKTYYQNREAGLTDNFI